MVTFSSPTPPQDLSEDIENQLLEALLCAHTAPTASPSSAPTSDISPLSLSRRFNISLHLVLDFLARSDTRARLAAALECSDILHHQHTQRARTRALVALESILDKSEDPIEIRRAATAILRPSRTVSPSSIRAHRDPPDTPARTLRPNPSKPSCSRDAQQTIWTVLDRLGDNHNPSADAGLTTLHNHLDAAAGFHFDLNTFLDTPGKAAELVGATSFALHPPTPDLDEYTHEQWATLTWPNLVTERIRFTLNLQNYGTHDNRAWYITDVSFDWELEDDDDEPDEDNQSHNSEDTTDDCSSDETTENNSALEPSPAPSTRSFNSANHHSAQLPQTPS